ncbi:MAG: DUF4129 domain-containing protein [Chthoniobacteraceae bacterium]
MKKKLRKSKPAIDLIEEAIHLLRIAPGTVHVLYYAGSVPFVLALLHFWSDMSRGAYAYNRIGGDSLTLGLMFVWMKCWHAASASKLRAFLSGSDDVTSSGVINPYQPLPTLTGSAPARHWSPDRIIRLVTLQAAIQPTALFIRPLALLVTIPYGWTRAFYENAVILADGAEGLRDLCSKAKRQAFLWPSQNHMALIYMWLFGTVVWLNIAVLLWTAPQLLKMFTGIETAFTRSPYAAFNTTFVATSVAFAYLFVNPVTKCIYVLRCFYGESVHTGDDLRLEMRRATAVIVSVVALFLCTPAGAIASPQEKPASAQVEPSALDSSIDRVLKRDEFAWRLPRQDPPKTEAGEGFLSRFFEDVGRTFSEWFKPVKKWIKELAQKLRDWMISRHTPEDSGSPSFGNLKEVLNTILWGLCVLIIALIGWLVWKNRRSFRKRIQVSAEPITAVPDLNSETILASQLPEDEWLKLAREMMEKGERRLAVRAFYLATLAHLGLRELIGIARYKSNRDYQRELIRRARTRIDLLEAFGQSMSVFEGVWYGSHQATDELLAQFTERFNRIRTS